VYGDTAEPTSLDCGRPTERAAFQICRLVADSLVDLDQDFHFIPRLAESFQISQDGLTITFRLRKGVRWHDGTAFTARDVVRTVESFRDLDPNGEAYRMQFGPLREVRATGDGTIAALYTEPFSLALSSWRETFIMPAHITADPNIAPALRRAPVGTGPFRFLRWDPQQQIVLEANKEYFGGRPMVDRYIQRIVPNAEALRTAALAGSVDVAPVSTEWAASHPDPDPNLPVRVVAVPTTYMELIYWNIDEPRGLFKDARVRRAMTMLLDRDGYTGKVRRGFYRTATTLIDPAIWGGDPSLRPYPFDVAGAARLLDEAGVKDRNGDGIRDTDSGPMSFTIIYNAATPEYREIGSLLERGAAQAGVQVRLQGLEWPVMKAKVHERQFEAALYRFMLEPVADPYAYFHSSQIGTGFNFGGYRSAEFDRLSAELRHTFDARRGAEILAELQRILHQDQPCTFVSIPGVVVTINRRFSIPDVTAAGLWNWYPSILRWWVPAAQRRYGREP
jgi:peptide/nickel transport system substrate-binding protein